jgi:beta-1,4-N-acetylglucosaminyltransferase
VILVAVGASQFPFDRLVRAVDDLPRDEPIVVQHGPSAIRPRNVACMDFAPLETFARLIRDARIVVTHAGVGSILLALTNGRKPYVVPRLQAFGETVDNHQVESARRFAQAGAVTLVERPELLAATIDVEASSAFDAPVLPTADRLSLVQELRDYLGAVLPTAQVNQ